MTQERLDEILAEASKYCNQPTKYYYSDSGTLITTIEEGSDKINELFPTMYYNCPFCGGSLTDKPPQDKTN